MEINYKQSREYRFTYKGFFKSLTLKEYLCMQFYHTSVSIYLPTQFSCEGIGVLIQVDATLENT